MPSMLNLFDLTNLSIGTPEVGAVNFNALHTLLHAIIKHLNIQDVQAEISDEERTLHQPPASLALLGTPLPTGDGTQGSPSKVAVVYHQMEKKVQEMQKQMDALNQLPTGTDLMERSKGAAPVTPVGDMWQMIQMKRKIEGNEDGISKAMALLQDLLNEINLLKTSRSSLESEILKLSDHFGGPGLPSLQERLGDIEKQHGEQQKVQGDLEKIQKENDIMQQALRDLEEKLKLYPKPEELKNMVEWEVLQEALVKGRKDSPTSATLLSQPPGAQPVAGQDTHLGTGATSGPGTQPGIGAASGPGSQISPPGTRPSVAGTQPFGPGSPANALGTQPTGQASLAPTTGTDSGAHPQPEHTSAQDRGSPPAPGLPIASEQGQPRREISPSGQSLSRSSSASLRYPDTVEALRQIGQLTDQYALLKELIDGLEKNKVDRSEVQQMTQLMETAKNLSGLPEIPTDLAQRLAAFEKTLEDGKEDRQKDGELLSNIQSSILQLQEECEKLNSTTGNLIDDHQQKQRHIDILYQSVEKLEEKKADKDHIEMEIDVKADKRALDAKVSRTQFDATNEQLNQMMQELLNKVTGQELDWQKVVDKISSEMESKLDRLELDPFKRQLEDRWKAIRKQLKDRSPHYEADEAAGIRKQLVARFHCLSCDRPVDMMVPGQHIMTVPNMPGLPCHRSNRPYTVYDLEQVRQHNKSERMPEMSDYGFMASRSCGGSHTLTFPHRRYTRLQSINPNQCVQPEEENILALLKQEEIDILGLDGQIYRGRMEHRFPAIQAKDASSKNRGKPSQCPVKTDADNLPDRPHSAKSSSRTHSALSRSPKDRHVSSQGRLSQTNLAHPPASTPLPEDAMQDSPAQEGVSGGSNGRSLKQLTEDEMTWSMRT